MYQWLQARQPTYSLLDGRGMTKIVSDGVTYIFADGTGGLQSIPDILQNFGTMYVKIGPPQNGDISGSIIFSSLYSDTFKFEINMNKRRFNFIRNKEIASQPLPRNTRKDLYCTARWDPESIDVTVLEDGYGGLPAAEKPPIETFQSETCTPYTTVPDQLLRWARARSYLQTTDVASADQFFVEFVNIIHQMQQTIEDKGSQRIFWNFEKGGDRARTPKAEPQVTAAIDLLLSDAAVRKDFQIVPQAGAAGGNLDFQVNKVTEGGGLAVLAMEAKHAHASDLKHGLINQLPAYMRAVTADFGIYLILWFKGEDFQFPVDSDFNALREKLELKGPRAPSNVRIMHLDLSIPSPPSKR